jgi:TRAP-type mannitol/chloroaromatic compound transport system substrate-binding protein
MVLEPLRTRLSVSAAVLAVCTTLAVLVSPQPAAAAGPRVLKMQASWPESLTFYDNFTYWANQVEALSDGSLRIETLPAGQIVPAPDVIDATAKKVIDGAHSWTGYLRNRDMSALLLAGGPGGTHGMDFVDFVGWLHQGGGLELYQEFFSDVLKLNVVPIPMLPAGPQAFGWFKKPIRNFADLKKLKCRQTGIAADVWRELGLTVVEMPGGEILAAARRDEIDCAEWFGGVEDLRLGLQNVWKYHYSPSVHESVAVGGLFINGDVWQSLSPQHRAIIKSAANETFLVWWVKSQKENADALKELHDKYGVHLLRTPPDVLEQFLKTWDQIAAREAERNPFFRKVWESQRKYAEVVVPAKRFYFPPYDQTADHYWPEDGREGRNRK